MNKTLFTIVFFAALLFFSNDKVFSKSWRINSDATKKPHFTSINAAMDSVSAGDTLYLDPGTNITAEQTISKQVTVIGPGYFLETIQPATISNYLFIRAPYTKLEGVTFTRNVRIDAHHVTIERCHVATWIDGHIGTYNRQYATIRQCYITQQIWGGGPSEANSSLWTIENNIIISKDRGICNLCNATVRNNYIRTNGNSASSYGVIYYSNNDIYNNIFINISNSNDVYYYANYDISSGKISNNVCSATNYYTEGNRVGYTSESELFTLEGSNENRYRLKDDSPAKGFATDGGDCGPFGGMYPYVLSGFPLGMPHFESSNVPTRPQDGQLRVTQKVVLQGE